MAKTEDKNQNQNQQDQSRANPNANDGTRDPRESGKDLSKDPPRSTTTVMDPVESAKGPHGAGTGGPTSTTGNVLPGGAGGSSQPPVGQPPEPILEQTIDKRGQRKGSPVYVVENPNNMTVSWKGQDVRLYPGAEISEDSYGDGAIEQFRTAGVKLREKTSND